LCKVEINNNKLRLICFMMFTLGPVPCFWVLVLLVWDLEIE